MSSKKIFIAFSICFLSFFCANGQAENGWKLFEKTSIIDKYIEEYYAYVPMLMEDDYSLSIDGKSIVLEGYYIPVEDEEIIVLSKLPFNHCFFCTNVGIETVAEIRMKSEKIPDFKMDQKIKFQGILKINVEDWEELSFILEDAVIVKN